MTYQDLLDTHSIADLEVRYNKAGVDFAPALEKSVQEAQRQFAGTTPSKAQFVIQVAALLASYLDKALEDKPAKTLGGRIVRFILRLFSGR